MEEERGLGDKSPRKFLKTVPFTLAINVTDALFGIIVVLEMGQKFDEFYVF